MSSNTFGATLRAARLRANFHTISQFADFMSQRGFPMGNDRLNTWELDTRSPSSRQDALDVLAALAERGGFTNLTEINRCFWLLGWRALDSSEIAQHFAPFAGVGMIAFEKPHYDRLIGRDDLVTQLSTYLQTPDTKSVLVISGLGGIGKTALAYEVAQRAMQSGLFESLIYESAQSEAFSGTARHSRAQQPINPHAILTSFARQLGLEGITDPNMLQNRLRDMLRKGSYLLILDNLETLDAAREVARLLNNLVTPPATAQPSKVIITSRERLADESFVYDHFLKGLSQPHTLELLQLEASNRNAASLLDAGDTLMNRIYTVTGGMPLAVKLIVSQYLSGIALDAELDRLERATDEEELYRFIYFTLWGKLSLLAQQVLVGAATFSTSALRGMLIQVSEVTETDFDPAITELVRMSLVEVLHHPEKQRQRYDMHAMTRWFVNAPLTEQWNQQKSGLQPLD